MTYYDQTTSQAERDADRLMRTIERWTRYLSFETGTGDER
jgi:hypothetical protein